MRIRGVSSISSSSSPSDDHCSSISTSSLDPSTISFDSTTSFSSNSCSSSSIHYETRCEGLDLLVKAVLHVAGSVLVVPFTQRRVIRRRKRSSKFSSFFVAEFIKNEEDEPEEGNVQQQKMKNKKKKKNGRIKVISKSRGGKRDLAFHDSVLQPWKRQPRQQRQPIFEIDD